MEGGLGLSTFSVCTDGLSKAFHYPIQLLTFYFFLNYLLIKKILNDILLRIPFSVLYSADLIGCR